MADTVKENAKDTTDGAWKAAKDTTWNIKEGPNKGSLKDSGVEYLRRRAGGYDHDLGDH